MTHDLTVLGAVAVLNKNGFETRIVAENDMSCIEYRRRFAGTNTMMGSIEIYGEDGNVNADMQARIDNIVANSIEMEIYSENEIARHPMSDTSLGIALQHLTDRCHNASYAAGWWHHADTGIPYIPGDDARVMAEDGTVSLVAWKHLPGPIRDMVTHYWAIFLGCKIALIHSEASEALEGIRKGIMDDKLQHRTAVDAELSDTMIREFDIAGAIRRARRLGVVDFRQHNLDIAVTFIEKIGFNAVRPDHKLGARTSTGGKYF